VSAGGPKAALSTLMWVREAETNSAAAARGDDRERVVVPPGNISLAGSLLRLIAGRRLYNCAGRRFSGISGAAGRAVNYELESAAASAAVEPFEERIHVVVSSLGGGTCGQPPLHQALRAL
jgi:hypothetical protein